MTSLFYVYLTNDIQLLSLKETWFFNKITQFKIKQIGFTQKKNCLFVFLLTV